jgi:hypothetical protein
MSGAPQSSFWLSGEAIALDVSSDGSPKLTNGGVVSERGELAIEAVDPAAIPVPGPFAGLPQTPALVESRLRRGEHSSAWHVAADFRQSLPTSSFWTVYAAGTYQNFPVFDHRLSWGIAGLYLFRVVLDPSRLSPGTYELEGESPMFAVTARPPRGRSRFPRSTSSCPCSL